MECYGAVKRLNASFWQNELEYLSFPVVQKLPSQSPEREKLLTSDTIFYVRDFTVRVTY